MSIASFHAGFKALTGATPIQYIKQLRLHQAKRLLVQEGMMVSTVSRIVGYESNSQFNREFKRFFGRSPLEELTLSVNQTNFWPILQS